MKVIGIGPGEPPPLAQDAELEAFMAERGWTYAAEWAHPWEDDDGVTHGGYWTRMIFKEVIADDKIVFQAIQFNDEMVARLYTWEAWVKLGEMDLERRCSEAGVDYERSQT